MFHTSTNVQTQIKKPQKVEEELISCQLFFLAIKGKPKFP